MELVGNSVHVKSIIKVDTKRPEVNVIGSSYKIMKGGVAAVVFKATDEAMKSLYIETNSRGKKFYQHRFIKRVTISLWLHGLHTLKVLALRLWHLIEQAI